jgi:hypothetical protein
MNGKATGVRFGLDRLRCDRPPMARHNSPMTQVDN